MQTNRITNILLGVIALVLIIGIGFFLVNRNTASPAAGTVPTGDSTATTTVPSQPETTVPAAGNTVPASIPTPAPVSTVPAGMRQYLDASFGFMFNYPQAETVTSGASGMLTLNIPGTELPITIVPTTNTAPDSNGKWGPYTISYTSKGYVAEQQDEQTGATVANVVTPIAYTTSGLPIFNGGIPSHGFGKYDYIVALSHIKFLTISGPDMPGNAQSYSAAADPTFAIATSVVTE